MLALVPFKGRNAHDDYRLGIICNACLSGLGGADATRALCARFKTAIKAQQTHATYHDDFVHAVIAVQPRAALDGLCGGSADELAAGLRILENFGQFRHNPLDGISDDELFSWCDENSAARYPAVARVIRIAHRKTDAAPIEWTSTARQLLDRAPDRVVVLQQYIRQFGPIWAGAELNAIESYVRLLDE